MADILIGFLIGFLAWPAIIGTIYTLQKLDLLKLGKKEVKA